MIAVADAFWAVHPDEFIAIHCAYGAAAIVAEPVQRSLNDEAC